MYRRKSKKRKTEKEKEDKIEQWAKQFERQRAKEKEKKDKQKKQKEEWEKIIRWNNPKNTKENYPSPSSDTGSSGSSTMYWTANSAVRSMDYLTIGDLSWDTIITNKGSEERNDFCGSDFIGPIETDLLQHTVILDPKQINTSTSHYHDDWTVTSSWLDKEIWESPHGYSPIRAHNNLSCWVLYYAESNTKEKLAKHIDLFARKGITVKIAEGKERKQWKQKWRKYNEAVEEARQAKKGQIRKLFARLGVSVINSEPMWVSLFE